MQNLILLWNEQNSQQHNLLQKLYNCESGVRCYQAVFMMTSSNGNIFRVTGHLCGEFTVPCEFPTQRPVTRSFDVFFDLRLNKRLSKQSWGWWFKTLSRPLWRHLMHRPPVFLGIIQWPTGSLSSFSLKFLSWTTHAESPVGAIDVYWILIDSH